jgi:hypothetical protein
MALGPAAGAQSVVSPEEQREQAPQEIAQGTMTRSPTWKRRTPSPTAMTSATPLVTVRKGSQKRIGLPCSEGIIEDVKRCPDTHRVIEIVPEKHRVPVATSSHERRE